METTEKNNEGEMERKVDGQESEEVENIEENNEPEPDKEEKGEKEDLAESDKEEASKEEKENIVEDEKEVENVEENNESASDKEKEGEKEAKNAASDEEVQGKESGKEEQESIAISDKEGEEKSKEIKSEKVEEKTNEEQEDEEKEEEDKEKCSGKRKASKSFQSITLKEGLLRKRGGIIKNWKERWFVLKPEGLYYFKSSSHSDPISSLPIKLTSLVEPMSEDELKKLKVPKKFQDLFFFKFVLPHRIYYCAATSEEDREEWIRISRELLEKKEDE